VSFSSGLAAGTKFREYNEGQDLRDLQLEERELGLDNARRARADQDELRRIVQDATTQIVNDRSTGGVDERRPREMTPDERMDLYEKLGMHSMKTGRMTPDQAMKFHQSMTDAEQEGMFDAYSEYRRTGDIDTATRMFNKRGKSRVDPNTIMPSKRKDPITGQEYDAYVGRAEDGSIMTFDPMRAAYETGGRKGFLESQKAQIEGRKVGAAERRNDLLERRYEDQYDLGLDAIAARRESAAARAAGGGRASVFQQKKDAYLAVNPGDEQGALDYASGRRTLSGREARLAAERMASTMRDSRTNQPLDAAGRRRAADEIYARITEGQADHSGATPPPSPAPRPGARPSLNQFLR
jgi:hypothetical protein